MIALAFSFGCGDLWEYEKNVYGNYYLVGQDTKDNISLYYKTEGGDYIKRIPSKVKEYAIIGDSLIVAKIIDSGTIRYYILNMKLDSVFAEKKEFLIGPLLDSEITNIIGNQVIYTNVKY